MIEKITIPISSLEKQKITEPLECFLELTDKYIRYRLEFYAEEPIDDEDEGLGWESKYSREDTYAAKTFLSGVDMVRMKDTARWRVAISVSGMMDDVRMYFKKEKDAQDVFDRVVNYLFGN